MNPFILNSVNCLNLVNLNWIKVAVEKPLLRRYSHCMTVYEPNKILVMGGISSDGVCKDVISYEIEEITDFV